MPDMRQPARAVATIAKIVTTTSSSTSVNPRGIGEIAGKPHLIQEIVVFGVQGCIKSGGTLFDAEPLQRLFERTFLPLFSLLPDSVEFVVLRHDYLLIEIG